MGSTNAEWLIRRDSDTGDYFGACDDLGLTLVACTMGELIERIDKAQREVSALFAEWRVSVA